MQPITLNFSLSLDARQDAAIRSLDLVRLRHFMDEDQVANRRRIAEKQGICVQKLSTYAYLQAWTNQRGSDFMELPSPQDVWQQVMPDVPFEVFEAYSMARARELYEQQLDEEIASDLDRQEVVEGAFRGLSHEEWEEYLEDLQEDAGMTGE